jgi:hypothetical protein
VAELSFAVDAFGTESRKIFLYIGTVTIFLICLSVGVITLQNIIFYYVRFTKINLFPPLEFTFFTTKPLGRPRRRWVNNIKMDLREIRWDGVDWIDMAQDRDQWRALVNTVLNLRVP